MTSLHSASPSSSPWWGEPIQIPPSRLSVAVAEIYCRRPVWRQVPYSIDDGTPIPRDLHSEVSATLEVLLSHLRKDPETFDSLTSRMVHSTHSPGVEPVLAGFLADHLAPTLTTRILDGVRASLAVQPEWVPLNLRPPGERGEHFHGHQELSRRLLEQVPIPGRTTQREVEVATTVAGREVWAAQTMPILLAKQDIPRLYFGEPHLALQRVRPEPKNGQVALVPVPFWRLDLAQPMVHPIGSIPFAAIPWPAKDAVQDIPQGSPAALAMAALAAHLQEEDPAWWTLADLLDRQEGED